MKFFVLAAVMFVASLAVTLPVKAGMNCQTSCYNVGSQRYCNTYCS